MPVALPDNADILLLFHLAVQWLSHVQTGLIILHTHGESLEIDNVALIPDFMNKQRNNLPWFRTAIKAKAWTAQGAEMKSKDSSKVNYGNENTIDPKSGM